MSDAPMPLPELLTRLDRMVDTEKKIALLSSQIAAHRRAEREQIADYIKGRRITRMHISKGPNWTEETGIPEVINAHMEVLASQIRGEPPFSFDDSPRALPTSEPEHNG